MKAVKIVVISVFVLLFLQSCCQTPEVETKFDEPKIGPVALKISPKHPYIFALYNRTPDGPRLDLIDGEKKKLLNRMIFPELLRDIAFFHNEDRGVIGNAKGDLVFIDYSDPVKLENDKIYNVSKKGVSAIAISDDDQLIGVALGFSIVVWNLNSMQNPIFVMENVPRRILDIKFNERGENIISADEGGLIRIWDIVAGKEIYNFRAASTLGISSFYSVDDNIILTRDIQGDIDKWDLTTTQKIMKFKGLNGYGKYVDLDLDQKRMISSSIRGEIVIWDFITSNIVKKYCLKNEESGPAIWLFPDQNKFVYHDERGFLGIARY